ncbi:hypothetical protein [Agrobacterium pusense]|uniref:Uncharacterized protein n=1 Tax=Agrobacterium pusense TaxID=648995 RepID=A0AA44ENI4_9HYPH|nr:hypothetical protein [Agrobacterium pusense]NRF10864.1 hypothetical protein [Agrobacterium pusense]NRF21574.1 hypothetical protein [Agrobacterium pusense]
MVKPRVNRVPVMMSESEMEAIDDWRFENRVATRSEAIRRLCQIGAEVSKFLPDAILKTVEIRTAAEDMIKREIQDLKGEKKELSEDDLMQFHLMSSSDLPQNKFLDETLELTQWLKTLGEICSALGNVPKLNDAMEAARDAKVAPVLAQIDKTKKSSLDDDET